MASVKAPLMSMDASGTIAGAITFSKWRGRNYVRRHAVPSNPKSGLQVGIRSVFAFVTQHYDQLSSAQQVAWAGLAAADNITELNAYVRDAIRLARRNLGWRVSPDAENTGTPSAPGTPTATGQPRTVVVDWVEPDPYTDIQCTAVYMSTTSGFTPDISNLVEVVEPFDDAATIIGLTTGTTYYFKVRHVSNNGELGTLTAELSAAAL